MLPWKKSTLSTYVLVRFCACKAQRGLTAEDVEIDSRKIILNKKWKLETTEM